MIEFETTKEYEYREFDACDIANAMRKCEIKDDYYYISKDLWKGLASLIERLGEFYKEKNKPPYNKENLKDETKEVLIDIINDLDFDTVDVRDFDKDERVTVVEWELIMKIFNRYGITEEDLYSND